MKKTNTQIIIFTIILICLCFLSTVIFTAPAFIDSLNLTAKNNIGGAIGGITAPIIGIVSSILLYLALTRQTESIVDQRIKNESDIIFFLINQLDGELNNFYHKFKKGNEEKKYIGLEALVDYCRDYRYEFDIKQFEDKPQYTFKTWPEASQIVLMVDSFNLIVKRIEISVLSEEMKELLQTKVYSYYNYKLRYSLSTLSKAFDIYPHQKDRYTAKIQAIAKRMEKIDVD